MRGLGLTAVILLLCIVAVVAYVIVGRGQMREAIQDVNKDNEALRKEVALIQVRQVELPQLRQQLPMWRRQLRLLKAAVPEIIEDDTFFDSLGSQLKLNDVRLLRIEMAKGTSWLGKTSEEELKKLADAGLDVATAKQIKVAFYSIDLLGNFDKMLNAFEGLKRHRRLYSIDQVAGPSSGGAGTITEVLDPATTPIQITGKIFFGIPHDYLSIEELDRVFADAVAVPVARAVKHSVTKAARSLRQDPAPSGDEADSAAGSSSREGK